jgi:dihydrofolate reductase
MINCIVAVERGQGIGFNGQMPWPRLKKDLEWFKEKTTDQIIIMGRNTWESIGSKKLPNRINIVVSRNIINSADYCFANADIVLDFCKDTYPNKEIFIIGGSAIYHHYLTYIDKFYVTEIEADYQCDRFFDLNYVQKNFTKVKEHAGFNEPIKYKIKEYSHDNTK